MHYDLTTTCPLARWKELGHDRLEYGIAGLDPCAVISDGGGKPYSWRYSVRCAVADQSFSSRCHSREACTEEATFWLKHVHCPGTVDREKDATGGAERRRSALFGPMMQFMAAVETAAKSYRRLTRASEERLQVSWRALAESHHMVAPERPTSNGLDCTVVSAVRPLHAPRSPPAAIEPPPSP